MAWITPPYLKEGDREADIAAASSAGRVSRLYKKLEYEKQIAQNVTAYQYSTTARVGVRDRGDGTARPHLQELEAAINEESRAAAHEGADRGRGRSRAQRARDPDLQRLQLVGGFGGVADQLNLYNHYLGTPDYLTQDIWPRRNVTPIRCAVRAAAIWPQRAGRRPWHPGKQILGPEVPKPLSRRATGRRSCDQRRRALAREAARSRARASCSVPVPQSFELPNGLTVIALPQTGGVPVVSGKPGTAKRQRCESAGEAGTRELHGDVLDQGTTTRNAMQLAEKSRRLARLSAPARRGMLNVTTSSLSRNFPAALSLLRCRASSELSERRGRARSGDAIGRSRAAAGNPVQIVRVSTGKALYGTHQYGFSETGTLESNKTADAGRPAGILEAALRSGNAALVVTGAITVPELRKLAQSDVRQLAARHGDSAKLGVPGAAPPRLVIVDRPALRRRSFVWRRSACRAAARTTCRCA
jgi:zinc protease